MTITFIGHGYVGLVTAAVFADLGNTVYVIGHTSKKIDNLKKGIIPIYEPGLEELVSRNVKAGRLIPTLEYDEAIPSSSVVFIAVGTPPQADGSADLSVVFDVAKKLAPHLQGHTVVNVKSTVPVGTNRKVLEVLSDLKPQDAEVDIASVPEFLREGQAISDTQHPDRIVIGTDSQKAKDKLVELHKPIMQSNNDTHLVLTNIETAEMIKYAANAFLATKISFANAIAQLSEKVGANGPDVLAAIGLDKRIGQAFLKAGAGYGGSCFPKDVKALIQISKSNGYDFRLLDEVENINKEAIKSISEKTQEMLGDVQGKTIGILGLAFKPDTDDMREAPSITIINELHEKGAQIKAYDPVAMDNSKVIFSNLERVEFTENAYDAVENADIVLIVTEWNEFKQLNVGKMLKLMKTPNMVDGRNIYEPEKMKEKGFNYIGVGR
ncbi:MAG TPA: UDP-glucose/GDP-mannose dehydrogenase family protein [Candidatus Levybacteria bacterium]|nr:UDP-glucose/GDP-mannose dehydrogenase family protein [Candidatus Levybacteria bacterium]